MKKERNNDLAHELRDRPAPPVKGCVTQQADICPRPEQKKATEEDRFWQEFL